MFDKLKEKLKSWFSSSKQEAEKQEKKQERTKDIARVKQKKPEEKKKVEEVARHAKEIAEQKPVEEKKGFFAKLREKFRFKISQEYLDNIWYNLEIILLENNVSIKAVDSIKRELENQLINKEVEKSEVEKEIKSALKQAIENLLVPSFDLIEKIKSARKETGKPFVILLVGINGSGKTTTIAKLAYLFKKHNLKPVLAAADTFRAASIEQLSLHANKLEVPIIKHEYNSDPASVGFDAIKYAEKNNLDVVLIDTAGRMHTKENLIKEMEKISRVTKPDLKIFIGEAITGNDATEQADIFNQAINLDAIILSKADVDEKGGTAISVSFITGKPILFLGTGQEYKDLQVFDKDKLIKELGL